MSVCLVIQKKNVIYIGTDTAICSKINDKFIRTGNYDNKFFIKDNIGYYCSGNLQYSEHIKKFILSNNVISIEKIIDYMKLLDNQYNFDEMDIELLVLTLDKCTHISKYNNFIPTIYTVNNDETRIISVGFKVRENWNTLRNFILSGESYFNAIYNTIIRNRCEEIGGYCKTYYLDSNGLKELDTYQVDNLLQERELNNNNQFLVNSEVLLGNLVVSQALNIHNANNSFVLDENNCVLTDATFSIIGNGGLNKILLDPINGFKIQKKVNTTFTDMIYLGTDGSAYFNGNIFGGSININNKFKVNSDGSVEMSVATLKSFQSLMANGKGLKVNEGISNIDGDCTISGNLVVRGNTTLGGNITWETHDTKFDEYSNTVQMHAAIKTSADSINLSVDTKINGVNQSISSIKLTTDNITLAVNANKLTFSSSGLDVYNAGLSIYNGGTKVFYVDTGGNVVSRGYYYGNGVTSDANGLTVLGGKFKVTDSSGSSTAFQVTSGGIVYSKGIHVHHSSSISSDVFSADDTGVEIANAKIYSGRNFDISYLKLNVTSSYVRIGDNSGSSSSGYYQASYSTSTNGYYHYFNGSVYMSNTLTVNTTIIFKGKNFNNVKQGTALTSSDYVMVAN